MTIRGVWRHRDPQLRAIWSLLFLAVTGGALFAPPPASAISIDPDEAFFDHYGRDQGLSNSAVSSIIQDDHGFLWFGTQGGLNRFDGRRVITYKHEPFDEGGLPHDLIQTMHEDPYEPYLWIGTYRGLSRFNLNTREFTTYAKELGNPNSLSNDVVTAIARDRDGTVWVGTLDGLNRLDPETGEIQRITTQSNIPGLPDNTVRALKIDEAGRLWIGTYGGLAVMDPRRDVIRRVLGPDDLPSPYVMSIHLGDDGKMSLGLWEGGLVRFDSRTGTTRTYELGDNRVYTVLSREDRYIFAGTWGGGLYRLDTESGEISSFRQDPTRKSTLSHDTVYSLAFDRSGALWIGTNGGGVNRLSNNKRSYLRFHYQPERETGISQGKITAIYRDSYDVLWIATYNGGLNRWDSERNAMIHYRATPDAPRRISNDIVTAIFEDSTGTLWVGTNDGLNRYNRRADGFTTLYHDPDNDESIPDDIVYAVEEDADGSLWIGTYSRGVSRWDRTTDTFTHYPHDPDDPKSLSDNLVYDILRDSRNRIWVATNRGLNRFDRATGEWIRYFHVPGESETLSTDSLRTLFEAEDESLWIGTASGGVNRFEPERNSFTHYTARDGLGDNTVVAIQQDDRGRLWFATTFGISVFDPETERFENLDVDDGIGGVEFNSGSVKDPDGALWFGGTHGVTAITHTVLTENTHEPRVQITGVSVMNRDLEPEGQTFNDATIELSHRDKSVSFEFVATDYEAPRSNRYRYRMAGFDPDFIDSGTRGFTTYTNLPGGTYTFHVEGSNNNGVWSDTPATLTVVVERSPYMRWWAFLLYGVFLVLVGLVIIRLRDRRLLQQEVEKLDSQRARLQNDNRLLGHMSVTDPLTAVYNRRYFDWRLQDSWSRARKSGGWVSIILVDIDRFKEFNDKYGHPEGDAALKSVAKAISESVSRANDVVARYGGEEFVVLLHNVDANGAHRVAENLRTAVAEIRIPHDASDVASIVTVSAGICTASPESGGSPNGLVAGSDRALYRAKQNGRNQTVDCADV